MFCVTARYEPAPNCFDEVLAELDKLIRDEAGIRAGCLENNIYIQRERREILTVSRWESDEDYFRFVDKATSMMDLMEIQSRLLRREIEIQLYDRAEFNSKPMVYPVSVGSKAS